MDEWLRVNLCNSDKGMVAGWRRLSGWFVEEYWLGGSGFVAG